MDNKFPQLEMVAFFDSMKNQNLVSMHSSNSVPLLQYQIARYLPLS